MMTGRGNAAITRSREGARIGRSPSKALEASIDCPAGWDLFFYSTPGQVSPGENSRPANGDGRSAASSVGAVYDRTFLVESTDYAGHRPVEGELPRKRESHVRQGFQQV